MNVELYPPDFPRNEATTPEDMFSQMEQRIAFLYIRSIAAQRNSLKAQIAAEKSRIIVGDRLPSPAITAAIRLSDAQKESATVEDYRAVQNAIAALVAQVMKWQTSLLEPIVVDFPECDSCS